MFNVIIDTWHGNPYDLKFKPDAEPYHGKPSPVPRIHELTSKQDFERLKALKFIKKVNRSQWGTSTFLIPKKYSTVRFISDFIELKNVS